MERFKNFGLWIAIAALVGMGLMDLGLLENLDRYNEYVEKALYILVLAGIISNPKEGKFFTDKSE